MNDFSWVWTGTIWRADPERLRQARAVKPPKPCSGVEILLNGKFATEPKKLFDAVSGAELDFTKTKRGIRIKVPEFEMMAVVVVQY